MALSTGAALAGLVLIVTIGSGVLVALGPRAMMAFERWVNIRSTRCDDALVKASGTSGFCMPWLWYTPLRLLMLPL